ncbi:hypothetical protein [Pseudomonas tohonis]|uniref:hypothetical protein n=1 Tax=Pseudomonas tohonis TaxID=2725477 RepID=UPI0022F12A77|nr:hypothetical protein [Pseudomonas tohonis]
MTKASEIGAQVKQRLEQITPANGYLTDVRGVFSGTDNVKDSQPKPYLLVRVELDRRTSSAGTEKTRLRTYKIEAVFKGSAEDSELDALGVDIQRALGFGRDDWDDCLPGIVDDEDAMEYTYGAGRGVSTRSLFVTIGVTYSENYN